MELQLNILYTFKMSAPKSMKVNNTRMSSHLNKVNILTAQYMIGINPLLSLWNNHLHRICIMFDWHNKYNLQEQKNTSCMF